MPTRNVPRWMIVSSREAGCACAADAVRKKKTESQRRTRGMKKSPGFGHCGVELAKRDFLEKPVQLQGDDQTGLPESSAVSNVVFSAKYLGCGGASGHLVP